ncbi:MAG: WYL domain-containing protein [Acidimicrobiia bacterium]|nr:WYL domain-containing protein [Acidimicrobiia bacterium]
MTSKRTVSRLSRILALIPYVLERESAEVTDVLERFGYTPEQLTRDLNTVFVCGLPGYGPGDLMEAFIDEDEVIIDAAGYFSNAPRLTPSEALGLLAAGLTVIGSGQGTPALERAVKKLTAVVMPDAESTLSVDVLNEGEVVTSFREAASEQRVVSISYLSVGKEELTERDIEPWSVFTALGKWYVTGFCRLVGDVRTFRLDRVKTWSVGDEAFERPEEVPEPGVGYVPSVDDVVCEISLAAPARWVMEYYPVEVLREGPRSTRVRFSSPDVEVPARLLLRLGGTATLVEGEAVRRRVEELGNELLTRYQ